MLLSQAQSHDSYICIIVKFVVSSNLHKLKNFYLFVLTAAFIISVLFKDPSQMSKGSDVFYVCLHRSDSHL